MTQKTHTIKTYLVGGAVRDYLLGLPVKDRDWVVVGADAQTMLAQGFQPVGKDFPVFLHPDTHEEYALARTERKTAKGYAGFSFHADKDVTLEQDLMRRDLTINAMAQDSDDLIIDPFGGQQDLAAGILRHVSPAFAEDPVRILRTARFAARYGFEIAEETMKLMRQMVENGEADALVAERVWQELAKGLMEKNPRKMIEVLRECWKYIKADNFVSEAQKVMICCMAIYLTPLEQRDSLFYFLQSPFIDDESETTETIVWEAINSFTGDNPYPSAKPVIAALFEAEKFNDYPYKDIIFDGEFKEKGFKVFWRENQFWLVILLLSLLLFISRFFW